MRKKDKLLKILKPFRQEHLLSFWDTLKPNEKKHLHDQILDIDFSLFKKQQEVFHSEREKPFVNGKPPSTFIISGSSGAMNVGKKLLTKGKVGVVILAGGQGTRLGFPGPKGTMPVTPLTNKTLFQLFFEKIEAASKLANHPLPLAVMTSSINHHETVRYLTQNQYFGLKNSQVTIFEQNNLPFLDSDGNMFLFSPQSIAEGPNGNGDVFHSMHKSGIIDRWKKSGIEVITFLQIDNPLAEPFDLEMIGSHELFDKDIIIKAVEREDPEEKVGLFVEENSRLTVREYTEFPEKEWLAKNNNHNYLFPLANISFFSMRQSFLEKAQSMKLPLHKAWKKVPFPCKDMKAWKFEKFIFDIFPHGSAEIIVSPRSECFAPLKNAEGKHSLPELQKALEKHEKKMYEKVTGNKAPDGPFELPIEYYYM